MTESIQTRAMRWIISGDTGTSSKAIWAHMIGVEKTDAFGYDNPHDPSDLGRCLRLLALIPEWVPRIGEMAEYGPGWAGLVAHWDELSALMADEVGIDWSRGRSAPRTYKAMKLAIADGYRNDPTWECRLTEEGFLRSASKKTAGGVA